jgi:hypothetical protein
LRGDIARAMLRQHFRGDPMTARDRTTPARGRIGARSMGAPGLALRAGAAAILLAAVFVAVVPSVARAADRVTVTGEVIDTWCAVSGIMFGYGTAHHQCAVWCAIGGIPVSIAGDDGKTYMVLRVEEDDDSVANPRIVRIQTHQVTVDGDLVQRDGVNYLIVSKVADDMGIVNLTQDEYGVQPFGE